MKVRLLSDLHIEFHPFRIPPLPDDAQTVLVLAGDIGVIKKKEPLRRFLLDAAAQFRAVVYVTGNHEVYGAVWPDAIDHLSTWDLGPNVHVLERQCVDIDDVTFIGTTLWTDFNGRDHSLMVEAASFMSDYAYIKARHRSSGWVRYGRLLPRMTFDAHAESRDWLHKTLVEKRELGRKMVLVTHHGVSPQSIHAQYAGHPMNGAFVNDMRGMLEHSGVSVICHGHIHNSMSYRIGEGPDAPRVLVNPRGYTQSDDTQENPTFDPLLTFVV